MGMGPGPGLGIGTSTLLLGDEVGMEPTEGSFLIHRQYFDSGAGNGPAFFPDTPDTAVYLQGFDLDGVDDYFYSTTDLWPSVDGTKKLLLCTRMSAQSAAVSTVLAGNNLSGAPFSVMFAGANCYVYIVTDMGVVFCTVSNLPLAIGTDYPMDLIVWMDTTRGSGRLRVWLNGIAGTCSAEPAFNAALDASGLASELVVIGAQNGANFFNGSIANLALCWDMADYLTFEQVQWALTHTWFAPTAFGTTSLILTTSFNVPGETWSSYTGGWVMQASLNGGSFATGYANGNRYTGGGSDVELMIGQALYFNGTDNYLEGNGNGWADVMIHSGRPPRESMEQEFKAAVNFTFDSIPAAFSTYRLIGGSQAGGYPFSIELTDTGHLRIRYRKAIGTEFEWTTSDAYRNSELERAYEKALGWNHFGSVSAAQAGYPVSVFVTFQSFKILHWYEGNVFDYDRSDVWLAASLQWYDPSLPRYYSFNNCGCVWEIATGNGPFDDGLLFRLWEEPAPYGDPLKDRLLIGGGLGGDFHRGHVLDVQVGMCPTSAQTMVYSRWDAIDALFISNYFLAAGQDNVHYYCIDTPGANLSELLTGMSNSQTLAVKGTVTADTWRSGGEIPGLLNKQMAQKGAYWLRAGLNSDRDGMTSADTAGWVRDSRTYATEPHPSNGTIVLYVRLTAASLATAQTLGHWKGAANTDIKIVADTTGGVEVFAHDGGTMRSLGVITDAQHGGKWTMVAVSFKSGTAGAGQDIAYWDTWDGTSTTTLGSVSTTQTHFAGGYEAAFLGDIGGGAAAADCHVSKFLFYRTILNASQLDTVNEFFRSSWRA